MLRSLSGPRFSRASIPAVVLLAGSCLFACAALEGLVVSIYKSFDREGKLVNGKHEGEWAFKYESGALQAKGNYVDDKQVGRWTYWFENGNVEWKGGFDDRVSGPTYFGYENGERRAIGTFEGGLEEDLWSFWNKSGKIDCEGDFVRGQPSLRWTYFHPDGTPRAEGFKLAGERVGPWQFYGEDGELSERRYPLPEGAEIVHELWDAAVPRREGLLVDEVQNGRWVTWHPSGRRRLTVDFVDGEPHGLILAWTDEGEPVSRGRMERGKAIGEWTIWRGGVEEVIPGEGLDLTLEERSAWSRQGNPGARSPERAVRLWLSEARSDPYELMNIEPDPNIPSPTAEAVAASDSVPTVPIRPQPWTVRETESLDFLIARYTDGAADVKAPRNSGYGRRRARAQAAKAGSGDPELSPKFIGTELPWTRFYRADGEVVDMDDYRGKKKIALVVLRGFAREVCVYCVTQTEALCDSSEEFQERDCEVFVVYPGEKNRLNVFMESFAKISKHLGTPPIGVLYDRNMQLVDRMGISSEFAIPSTFVIDEGGVIRYSYVGEEIDDRPAATDVLEAIDGMARP